MCPSPPSTPTTSLPWPSGLCFDPGHEEHVHLLSGPERLLAQRLAVLADMLRRDLRFHPLTDEEAQADIDRTYAEGVRRRVLQLLR
ncbi:hypothetical protein SGLAM104S_04863 [Streptomyces glaucescens]